MDCGIKEENVFNGSVYRKAPKNLPKHAKS